jgi:multidrug resistance efflux pump
MQLLPSKRVEVRSEIEGLVEDVLVREGQWVEAGHAIALLSRRTPEKNLKATQARLEEARAELELLRAGPRLEQIERAESAVRTAETNLAWSEPLAERYAELYEDELISQQQYDNALRQRDIDAAKLEEARADLELVKSGAREEQIQAMEAQVQSLQALVDNYQVDVERTTLTSPIAGRIITPRVEELAGTYLKPGQRDLVVQIEDARIIRAEVEVPEEDVADIRIGSRVKVVTWAHHDTTFYGQVVSIAPVAATNEVGSGGAAISSGAPGTTQVAMAGSSYRVVRVITEIPNPDGTLKSEMTGYAKIATGDRPVWDVLLRPLIRWFMVEVWYWIP